MRKFLLGLVGILLIFVLFGCFLVPTPETLQPGYYVIFNFQYKAADGAEDLTVLPGLKMEEVGDNEYKLTVTKADLASLLENKDKDGVYWWTVAKVEDPSATGTWIVYGGTGAYDPSVPFLKEDFDALSDTDTVEFYAIIPDSTDTIVGLGDNLKDSRDFYFVGDVTSWGHVQMENAGNGLFEATITATDYIRNLQYKIWPADTWDASETLKALAFNGVHYYATGGNGTYEFSEDVKEFKVVFDPHHSMVNFEPIKATTIETIGSVKERLLADDSATFTTTVRGVVTYENEKYNYLIIQDDTDAIKIYKSGINDVFDRGDLVLISGEALVYKNHDFEILPESSELISSGNPDPVPLDITGTFIDDASPLYGKLVQFVGTVSSTDTYGNVTFLSEGTDITVNYAGYNWQTGVEYTVKGVIIWIFDRYKVVPRDEGDILQGDAIFVDGSLSDWKALEEDAVGDCYWSGNDIFKVGLSFDATNLYLAGDFSKTGNNLMFLIDISYLEGSNTTFNHPWNRNYIFDSGDIDLVVETWGNGLAAWKVDSNGDFSEITNDTESAYSGSLNDGEERFVEIKIPWSSLGVTSIESLQVSYATVITGGFDGTSQWLSDLAPEQDLIDSQNPSPVATITNFYTVNP